MSVTQLELKFQRLSSGLALVDSCNTAAELHAALVAVGELANMGNDSGGSRGAFEKCVASPFRSKGHVLSFAGLGASRAPAAGATREMLLASR
jgi:hypothetical protein